MPARLARPIRAHVRYIVSPQYLDFVQGAEEFIGLNLFKRFRELLNRIDGLVLRAEDLGEFPSRGSISIHVREFSQQDFAHVARFNPFPELYLDSIVLEFVGEWLDPNEIACENRRLRVIDRKRVVQYTCASYVREIAAKILVLMSIYLPGSSKAVYSYSNFDYGIETAQGCVSHFANVAIELERAGIDPTPRMSFSEFLAWSYKQVGYWNGLPDRNVARALNIFSHAHHQHHQLNTLHDIAWIVAAVETILTENNVEIRARIARRVRLLCPDVAEKFSRKRLLAAYDFRSRFLHGDIKIPNHFSEGSSRYTNYRGEFNEAGDVLALVLIRTLQSLAEAGATELAFGENAIIQ